MLKWEDIQAEVLRQDAAEREQEIIKNPTGRLGDQISLGKELNDGIPKTKLGQKLRKKLEREQARSPSDIGGSDEEHDPSLESKPRPCAVNAYNAWLQMTEAWTVAVMRRDYERANNVLGLNILIERQQALDKKFSGLYARAKSNVPRRELKEKTERLMETLDELQHQSDRVKIFYRMREKVLWTIVTVPPCRTKAINMKTRINVATRLPYCISIGRWKIFQISRTMKTHRATKIKLQNLLKNMR
ncbi:MAG: hypothetical protein M1822_003079 [Bathelium mastoideum]|nr:MAG: hypothetical protein M1822_003079 [Bathelium mastoideum]